MTDNDQPTDKLEENPLKEDTFEEEKTPLSLAIIREKATSVYIIFVKVVFTFVILAALYNVLTTFNDNKLSFHAFDVPHSLEARGYTGKEIARRISDRINHIRNNVKTHIKIYKTLNTDTEDEIPEFQVPGADISLNAIIAYMRMFFGQDIQSVDGSIVEAKKLNMIVRISGYPSAMFTGHEKDMENLISQAAEHVLMHLEPFSLALFYKENKNIPALMRMIKKINTSLPSEQDKVSVHIISSFVFSLQKNYIDAEKSALKAVHLAPQHSYALHNYSLALVDTDHLEEAISVMRRLVKVYPNWSTHNNMAYVYMMLGQHQKAIEEIKISLTMEDAKYDQCYDTWAAILNDQGEYDQAIEKTYTAMEYAMPNQFDYFYDFLARVQYKQNHLADALESYQKVIISNPKGKYSREAKKKIRALKNLLPKQ
ncbi:MAG: hypothetical protein Q9M28_06010 [Mariprofundaceae bacterium]|nr:hypothetical protein [Mariprofundaceae bacterium]